MEQVEEHDAYRVFQDPSLEPGFPVLSKLISVGNVNPASLVLDCDWPPREVQADLLRQVVTQPDVVISRKVDDPNPVLHERVKGEEHLARPSGYDGAIFKPEVEQVAHDI